MSILNPRKKNEKINEGGKMLNGQRWGKKRNGETNEKLKRDKETTSHTERCAQ